METIRFMYFLKNFSSEQLKGFFEATNAPAHIESKLIGLCENLNGSQALFELFYELSRSNQFKVIEYVNANYKGMD